MTSYFAARKSTILPLPSSPHCRPMSTSTIGSDSKFKIQNLSWTPFRIQKPGKFRRGRAVGRFFVCWLRECYWAAVASHVSSFASLFGFSPIIFPLPTKRATAPLPRLMTGNEQATLGSLLVITPTVAEQVRHDGSGGVRCIFVVGNITNNSGKRSNICQSFASYFFHCSLHLT